MFYYDKIKSKIGILTIKCSNEYVLEISFDDLDVQICKNHVTNMAKTQLIEYFENKRKTFDLPLLIDGTIFQKKVWNELRNISYGKTVSYKDIAIQINSPKAFRAVGNANNKNKLPIVIPCHRVIGSSGKLVGFAGGLSVKEWLLNFEKRNI